MKTINRINVLIAAASLSLVATTALAQDEAPAKRQGVEYLRVVFLDYKAHLRNEARRIIDEHFRPAAEAAVWDRQLPGVIINHLVADFDAWLEGYTSPEADAMRSAAGVIGHAANQGIDNPNLALVYHQAETFDELRALAGSDELRHVMKAAGVTSEPEFTYHTGGWAGRY